MGLRSPSSGMYGMLPFTYSVGSITGQQVELGAANKGSYTNYRSAALTTTPSP
ncbi:MAG: hypothetical protein IPF64_17585 [Flavobacteriales bacterium]|nr:hypothetical protein [Flavobacteriales bacterium]